MSETRKIKNSPNWTSKHFDNIYDCLKWLNEGAFNNITIVQFLRDRDSMGITVIYYGN